jgi:hypothetical protein
VADKMMNYKAKIQHPWQIGPAELIAHAIEHMHEGTDFDNRIAFLLFDVGVETLFKTFLLLPDKVTRAKNNFADRKKAVESNFHSLVQGVEHAKPQINQKYNLAYIQFFHDTRNKLYHEGNGITVDVGKVNEYAQLAVNLLRDLLEVDLDDVINAPAIIAQLADVEKAKWKPVEEKKDQLMQSREKLAEVAKAASEILAPDLAKSVFVRALTKRFSETPEKADAFLIQAFRRAFPNKKAPLHELNVADISHDSNKLYLFITNMLPKTDDVLGLYELAAYDPTLIVLPYEEEQEMINGEVVTGDHRRLSTEEYAAAITNWILDVMTDIKRNTDIIEEWLDQQSV